MSRRRTYPYEVHDLVATAEQALLHLAYMNAEWGPEWDALEKSLTPFRPNCACGMKNAPPMHLNSAPYFCERPDDL